MPVAPKAPQYKRHPLAVIATLVLDAQGKIAAAASGGADTLLVSPSSATNVDANGGSVVRMVDGNTAVLVRVTSAIGLLAADSLRLVYKAEGGREAILANVTASPLGLGETIVLVPNSAFAMSPTDLGLFLRVVQAVPLVPVTVDAVVQAFDVRGPVRVATDVDAVEAIVAAGGSAANAEEVLANPATSSDVLVSGYTPEAIVGSIHNYDTLDHEYQLFVTDGVTAIEISNTATPPSVPARTAQSVVLPALPPGWSLKMSLGEAVATTAPRFIASPTPTNADVARDNQAGAY
jgi:hypothetical protein